MIAPEGRADRLLPPAPQTRRTTLQAIGAFLSGFAKRAFTLVFLSRLFFSVGIFSVFNFVYYIITDYTGVANIPAGSPKAAVATIASMNVISQIAPSP
ncbi:hypothetical protein VUN82_10465 [Micrococcaceae bacterium Sec5.1]